MDEIDMSEVPEAEYRKAYPERVRRWHVMQDGFVDVTEADWELLQQRLVEKGSSYVVTGRTQADWNSAFDELLWRIKMTDGVTL